MKLINVFKRKSKNPVVDKERIRQNRDRLFRTWCSVDFKKLWLGIDKNENIRTIYRR